MSIWMNIPWYIMCHVAAHALYGLEDAIDAVLRVIVIIAGKFPDIGGRTFFGKRGRGGLLLSFGTRNEARAACRPFATMLSGVYPAGFTTIGISVACGLLHRYMSYVKSLVDIFSYHARGIVGGYFDTAEEAENDCKTFRDLSGAR